MKKIVLLLGLLTSSPIISLWAQDVGINKDFILTGKVIGLNAGFIFLSYITNGVKIKDTTKLDEGSFSFHGFIKQSCWGMISIKSDLAGDENKAVIFLEPGSMKATLIKNNFKESIITGSKTEEEWESLKQTEKPYLDSIKKLDKEYLVLINKLKHLKNKKIKAPLLKELNSTRDKYTPYNKKIKTIELEFITIHNDSYLSAYLLRKYADQLTIDSIKEVYSRLSTTVRQGWDGKRIEKLILKREGSKVGNTAPDFLAKDINGKNIRLSSFKGKDYVLLDFWASWCIPCLRDIPNLKSLYQKYHQEGLQFIAISEDTNKESWADAIEKENISNWINLPASNNPLMPLVKMI